MDSNAENDFDVLMDDVGSSRLVDYTRMEGAFPLHEELSFSARHLPEGRPHYLTMSNQKLRYSVSTTFFPGSTTCAFTFKAIIFSLPPRIASIIFSLRIIPAVTLHNRDVICLTDHSSAVNIILHAVFNISCRHYSPTLEELVASVSSLQVYGLPLETYIAASSPIYDVLLSHAMITPLEVYALAAQYELEDLAVATSAHLHSLPLPMLSDQYVSMIGSSYLKRLIFLHISRTEAFKSLLVQSPDHHTPTTTCSIEQQSYLTRAWAMTAATLSLKASPDIEARTIEAEVRSVLGELTCELCKTSLVSRLRVLVAQWSCVKRTI